MTESRFDSPNTHLDEDAIVDILGGLVPREDIERILAHVRVCDECEALFRARVGEFETLRARGTPIPGKDGTWVMPTTGTRRPGRRQRRWGFLAALRPAHAAIGALATAAIATATVVALLLFPSRPPVDPPVYWMPAGREIRELRSGGSEADERLWRAIDAYDARDAARAVELLVAIEDTNNTVGRLRSVYLASALTLTGRYDEALRVLDSMQGQLLPQPWRGETRWTRYIALVGRGDEGDGEEAAAILDELAREEGRIGDLARERTRELDRR